MAHTDPIADYLTRIRNAHMAGHDDLVIPASYLKGEVTRILKSEGYIRDYRMIENGPKKTLHIRLKYYTLKRVTQKYPMIKGIRRMSKPGCRHYLASDSLPTVQSGLGVGIYSTSSGVMTDREAREKGIGGEYICEVW